TGPRASIWQRARRPNCYRNMIMSAAKSTSTPHRGGFYCLGLLGRLQHAGKIRHCVAQHAVNSGALPSLEIALEFGEPALDYIDRRANRSGGNHAFNTDVGRWLFARKKYFVQPLTRTNSGKHDIDIASRLEATETNHSLGEI